MYFFFASASRSLEVERICGARHLVLMIRYSLKTFRRTSESGEWRMLSGHLKKKKRVSATASRELQV